MLQAAQSKCYYPNYLWIVPGWYSENWWKDFPNYLTTIGGNCTLKEIEQALNRSLTLLPVPAGESINDLPKSFSYAADAVKALAIAINTSAASCTSQKRQCMFTDITNALRNIKFDGLSVSSVITIIKIWHFLIKGIVSFNNAGGRKKSQVILQQYRQQQYSMETILCLQQ